MDKKHVWVIVLIAAVAFGFFAGSVFWRTSAPDKMGLIGKGIAEVPPGGIGETLRRVISTGKLKVGVNEDNITGLIKKDGSSYIGMEADIARAIASAIFDVQSPTAADSHIEWIPINGTTRFQYLNLPYGNPNRIDVAIRSGTINSGRDVVREETGFEFSPVYHYDGTDVLLDTERLPVEFKYNIIVGADTSNKIDLERLEDGPVGPHTWPTGWQIKVHPGGGSGAKAAFITGVFTPEGESEGFVVHGFCSDGTVLYAAKKDAESPTSWVLQFPGGIGKSPLAAIVKEGDTNWAELVSWVINVLKQAEEDNYSGGDLPDSWMIRDSAGNLTDDCLPQIPGLNYGRSQNNTDWPKDVIAAVGNYDNIWNINYPGVPRLNNELWDNEGLHISPPLGLK